MADMAAMLHGQLLHSGITAVICNYESYATCISALDRSFLLVVLGSTLYGMDPRNERELRYIFDERKRYFLVKFPEPGKRSFEVLPFAQPLVRFLFAGVMIHFYEGPEKFTSKLKTTLLSYRAHHPPPLPPDVFISHRLPFSPLAHLLKQELESVGVATYFCDESTVPPGGDFVQSIVVALDACKLIVVLGNSTYGQRTLGISTFEEMRYISEARKPFFLAKLCNARFTEPETMFRLSGCIQYYKWLSSMEHPPATDTDDDVRALMQSPPSDPELVRQIKAKLDHLALPIAIREHNNQVLSPQVFLSFRFGSRGEALSSSVKTALEAQGIRTFRVNTMCGDDVACEVAHALFRASVSVIFANDTYGTDTHAGYSTFEELRCITGELSHNPRRKIIVVNLCSHSAFTEPETSFRLDPDVLTGRGVKIFGWAEPDKGTESDICSLVEAVQECVGMRRKQPLNAIPSKNAN